MFSRKLFSKYHSETFRNEKMSPFCRQPNGLWLSLSDYSICLSVQKKILLIIFRLLEVRNAVAKLVIKRVVTIPESSDYSNVSMKTCDEILSLRLSMIGKTILLLRRTISYSNGS